MVWLYVSHESYSIGPNAESTLKSLTHRLQSLHRSQEKTRRGDSDSDSLAEQIFQVLTYDRLGVPPENISKQDVLELLDQQVRILVRTVRRQQNELGAQQ